MATKNSNYINQRGLAAGPIRITDISNQNFDGQWIVSYNNALYITKTWNLSSNATNYLMPVFASSNLPVDTDDTNMLVTAGWVRTYFKSGDPGSSGTADPRYALQQDFQKLVDIVMGDRTEYTEDQSLIDIASIAYNNANTALSQTNRLTIEVESIKDRLTTLEVSFEDFKVNPFPDGVVFIGGGATYDI